MDSKKWDAAAAGRARAKVLSAERRHEIASKAGKGSRAKKGEY
jgi:hypothetical protein